MRIEVHTDNKPLAKQKGKKTAFTSNQALTDARAKKLASLFKEQGIPLKRFTAVGMGDRLAKSPDTTPEGLELNNRVEIVAYPADVKVVNSQKLPVLADRNQVLISVQYTQGPVLAKLRVIEKLAKSMQYVPGSSYFRGRVLTPVVKGDDVQWELGDMESNFAETLVFAVKNRNGKNEVSISDTINLSYESESKARSRVFDPKMPAVRSSTIRDACLKCHSDVMSGLFKHGPIDAGYCTLCHDPHASENAAWLRKPSWELCTTCHDEKATERHVLAGLKKNASHPTKHKRDPARRGKRMACVSCHEPHSAESRYLFAFGAKERFELCGFCHGKKL
jgi:predicted CXXCH cytochrome family protein